MSFSSKAIKVLKKSRHAATLAASLSAAASAHGVVMFYTENFDTLPLNPYVVETGGDGTDYTKLPPAGWQGQNGRLPQEWLGWSFANKQSWITAAGNQDRAQFTKGTNIVAIADPDEFDDFTGVEPNRYNVFMRTPVIDLTNSAANSVNLTFDSSFRPYDGMRGIVRASFDGGASFTDLLELNTGNSGGNSSLSRVNETINQAVGNPNGGQLVLEFGMRDAGNDWWWAIDNVTVADNTGTRLSENFDSLPLFPFITEAGGTGSDFTKTPPQHWTTFDTLPRTEFHGFSFIDKQAWINAAGNQERSLFTLGNGAVMVADPDEFDDVFNVDPGNFNTFMVTQPLDISKIIPGSITLEFDSSFRPYDAMEALVEVSFDGGSTFQNLLAYNTLNSGGNSSLMRINEHVLLNIDNPLGAQSMIVRFGMINAGNDWWWAVDNIAISGDPVVPEPATGVLGLVAAVAMLRRRSRTA